MTIGSEEFTNSNISVIANGKFSSLVENGWQTASDNKGGNSELKIYGGAFYDENAVYIENAKSTTDDKALVMAEITDGNFKGKVSVSKVVGPASGSLIVTGGTFANSVIDYVPEALKFEVKKKRK